MPVTKTITAAISDHSAATSPTTEAEANTAVQASSEPQGKVKRKYTTRPKNAIPGLPKEIFRPGEARQYVGDLSESKWRSLKNEFKLKPALHIGDIPFYTREQLDAVIQKLIEIEQAKAQQAA